MVVTVVVASAGLAAAAAPAPRGSSRTGPRIGTASPPVLIPDTNFPIPDGALFVSPTGDDTNPGTIDAPFQTVTHAISVATPGSTIVLRAGVYRESFGDVSIPITIQPYPHEQAWLSGSDVIAPTDWDVVTNGWVHHGWTAQFCRTCYAPGAVDNAYPLAGWPDQVFFDGTPLTQVSDVSQLAPGTFYVDYVNDDLYVGSDPTVPSIVEATSRTSAGDFRPSAAGSIVQGIGFMQYGTTWNENTNAGEIEDSAPNTTFQDDVFTQASARGLFVLNAANVSVLDSEFLSNGYTGLYVRGGDYFDLERNLVDNNNTKKFFDGFSNAAGAGGVKISSSAHVTVKGNTATNNYGNGIWNDVSSYDVDYIDNYASGNDRNGFYIEITGTFVVASNLSTFNGQAGLKISGGTNGRIYNNTFANNATYQVSVHDDGRDQPDPAKRALGITWDTANNTFVNNILAAPAAGSTGPLLYTENTENPIVRDASTMITGMDYDLFTRPTVGMPAMFAKWIHPAPTPATVYTTLAGFQAGTGYETNGVAVDGYTTSPVFNDPVDGDYSALSGGPAFQTGSPLPTDIAAMIGVTPGVVMNRGALIYPGSSPLPPPPPPPPPPTIYATDTFSRVVNAGWGSADTGGTWGLSPAGSPWSVNGSVGNVTVPQNTNALAGITPLRTSADELTISFTSTAPATAQPRFVFIVRNINGQHQYRARVRITTKGAVVVGLLKVVSGTTTLIGPEVTVPGVTYTPGTWLQVRADAVGTGPTTLRMRAWAAGTTEPTVWNTVQTDNEPTMQGTGTFGLLAIAPAGPNVPSTFSFDNLSITSAS